MRGMQQELTECGKHFNHFENILAHQTNEKNSTLTV